MARLKVSEYRQNQLSHSIRNLCMTVKLISIARSKPNGEAVFDSADHNYIRSDIALTTTIYLYSIDTNWRLISYCENGSNSKPRQSGSRINRHKYLYQKGYSSQTRKPSVGGILAMFFASRRSCMANSGFPFSFRNSPNLTS